MVMQSIGTQVVGIIGSMQGAMKVRDAEREG